MKARKRNKAAHGRPFPMSQNRTHTTRSHHATRHNASARNILKLGQSGHNFGLGYASGTDRVIGLSGYEPASRALGQPGARDVVHKPRVGTAVTG